MGKNEPMENSEKRKFEGVGNLKIFHTVDINEMVAIFQFFHNG